MNKKMIRTGIFSLTALLGLAVASPYAVSAHGYDSEKTMEKNEYGHHMQNDSWDENQESRNENHSMYHEEERFGNRENMHMHRENHFSRGNCRANSRNKMHKNSKMMKSEGWSESMMNHHSLSRDKIGNNR